MKNLFYTIVAVFGLMSVSFAETPSNRSVFFRPYWSVLVQANVSSLSNHSYNMEDVFGKSNDEFGYGGGIGVGIRGDVGKFNGGRLKLNGLYFGVEAFVNADYILHKKATGPYRGALDQVESEEVKIMSVFNARVNVGYNFGDFDGGSRRFIDKLTIFGSVGMRHFEYESTYSYTDYSMYYMDEFIKYNDWVIAPTFGIGIIYSMTKRLDFVFGYEYSFFGVKDKVFDDSSGEGKVRVRVNTLRIGLNYLF